jgi:hypothetical protein
MQVTEDDKAKASGIALAAVGLILSKFSLLAAVLAGGAAVYSGKIRIVKWMFEPYVSMYPLGLIINVPLV